VTAVLSAHNISVSFGGVRAVVDVSLDVEAGQLVGLIGPNGAGKTTFIDAVTGFVAHSGSVRIDGRDVTGSKPHVRARRGLSRTWQATELFDDLSVRENLTVAARHPTTAQTLKEVFSTPVSHVDAVDEALEQLALEPLADAMPAELTQGQRKMVAVARALSARPKLLLLDEPAAGLDVNESADLGHQLRKVVDHGTPVLLVDHDMGLVLGICDQLVVVESGSVIGRGSPAEIRENPQVVEAYLGATDRLAAPGSGASPSAAADPAAPAPPVAGR
jgi:branched-chain amino acid transport system ATP-binding protein